MSGASPSTRRRKAQSPEIRWQIPPAVRYLEPAGASPRKPERELDEIRFSTGRPPSRRRWALRLILALSVIGTIVIVAGDDQSAQRIATVAGVATAVFAIAVAAVMWYEDM